MIDYFKSIFKAIFPFLVKSPISMEFKNKIILIWKDVIGFPQDYSHNIPVAFAANNAYKFLTENVCRRFGYLTLNNVVRGKRHNYCSEIINFFLSSKNIEEIKYVIFVSFAFIDSVIRENDIYGRRNSAKIAEDAINYLNELFGEYKVNLRYCNNALISSDDELIQTTVIKPTMLLLANEKFESAEKDFSCAYDRYLRGQFRDSIIYCASAFESTIKIILKHHNHIYNENSTIHRLLDEYFKVVELPDFAKKNVNRLKECLECVSVLRNEKGPHGNAVPIEIPDYYAWYMFHMTAATVKFVVEFDKRCNFTVISSREILY